MTNYEKPDFWSQKAQKEGYPARSVYKLREIDEKYNFFNHLKKGALRVLDLGAAPGSWSLYVLRHYGKNAKGPKGFFLVAADLQPLSENPLFLGQDDFFFIQGDFTVSTVRDELVHSGPYSAIICDAAPPTTGDRTVDTQRSLSLAEEAFSYAENCLVSGGNLAVKIFQGDCTAALLQRLRKCFERAKSFKPASCRRNSFETYLLGFGKKI
jgi:23S rRNA (uridine2552-2'-O)-methyltransferase